VRFLGGGPGSSSGDVSGMSGADACASISGGGGTSTGCSTAVVRRGGSCSVRTGVLFRDGQQAVIVGNIAINVNSAHSLSLFMPIAAATLPGRSVSACRR